MGSLPYLLIATAGLTLVTIATRSSFFMLPARIELPERLERALRYAPACALTAIISQSVFARHGHPYVSVHNNQIWALLAAALVFAKTRNMIAMMVVGMAVFTALRLWV
jgi:branched-subunit amino acid transport protein